MRRFAGAEFVVHEAVDAPVTSGAYVALTSSRDRSSRTVLLVPSSSWTRRRARPGRIRNETPMRPERVRA